jgi:outer membrane protein assembly factor BamA
MKFLATTATVLCLFVATLAQAESRVAAIEFSGNHITHESVLAREITLRPGDVFFPMAFEESLQNIRNLRIFREVTGTTETNAQGDVVLKITILEKQTLLPFFRLKRGGGSTLLTLGVGDLNTLGHGFEFLPMYENLNQKYHGGRVDVRVPRVNGWRTTVDASLAREARSHTLFTETGAVAQTYLDTRQSAKIAFEHNLTPHLLALVSGLVQDVRARDANAVGIYTHTGIGLGLGRLNYRDYRLEGTFATVRLENIFHQEKQRTQSIQSEIKSFLKVSNRTDLAFRSFAHIASSNTSTIHQCSLGGFGEVRGFSDERFRGTHCWFLNAEVRHVAFAHPWYVIQPTAFADIGATGLSLSQSAFRWQKSPASLGGGFRVVFPYLARLILRADAGFPISPQKAPAGFSFGSVQFF